MPGLDTYDDAGNLAASNSSDAVNNPTSLGFGPAWRRYITSGLYNSEFALPTADLTQSIDNVNNPLPYWNVVYSGSGAQSITAQWLADSASASGGVIRFTMTAASLAGDGMQLEQLVALNSSRSQNWCYQGLWVTSDLAGATGTARSTMNVDWIASDGVTVVGTGMSGTTPVLAAAATAVAKPTAVAVPPTNAAFARVRVGVNATANGDVCTVDGTDVLLRFFSPQLYLPEYSTPGTFDPSLVYSSGGVLRLQAPNGSQVTWDGSALTFGNGDTATAFTSGTGQGQAFQSVWKASSGLVGPSIAGAPTDANAAGSTTLNGAIATDNTNSRWYTRVGGTWKFVAVAGERIPPSERRCPRCLRLVGLGQEAVGVVNEIQADHTRHMLWNHRRCGFRYRLARALRLVPDHTAWYTAAIRRVERRWVDRHELQVIEGGKVA